MIYSLKVINVVFCEGMIDLSNEVVFMMDVVGVTKAVKRAPQRLSYSFASKKSAKRQKNLYFKTKEKLD